MNGAEQFSALMADYITKIATKILDNKTVSGVTDGVITQVHPNGSYRVKLSGSNEDSSIEAFAINNKSYQKDDSVYMIYYLNG